METRAGYIVVGVFVVALVAAAFGFVIFLARFQLHSGITTYQSMFAGSVAGLEVGSRVRYRGVPVGTVRSIRIDPENIARIRVLLDIDEGTPIKADTTASLQLQGVTGIAYVNLTGGTQESPALVRKEGEEYPTIPANPSTLERVLEDLPRLFERAVEVTERLAEVLDVKNRGAISETLDNMRRLTGELASRTETIDRILLDAEATARSARQASETTDRLVTRLESKAGPITDDAERVMRDARAALADARRASQEFAKVAETLDKIVTENRRPIADFSGQGLYEMTQFMTEARVLVENLNNLVDQIQRDPARFFFGDTKRGYEAR